MNPAIVHRALVTYSNERTGEIRVKVPAVTGLSEMSISYVGRLKTNNIWIVPDVGEQITVSADDTSFTNLFWLQTDGYVHSKHYRNYFEALDTTTQYPFTAVPVAVTFNTVVFSEGIRLVDNSKITFDYEGIYNLQYSIQWENASTQIHDTAVWIAYNNQDYPNSNTFVAVPSSHGGTPGYATTAINFVGKAYVNDFVQLKWASNGNVSMKTVSSFPAGFPASMPAAPSVIVTVTQVA